MKKSISITFTFDFATRLSSYSLFDIGSDKNCFDQQKTIEDFSHEYHSTFKAQLASICSACADGQSISVYLSTDFIQLLHQEDSHAIENIKAALSTGNLELLGGLDRADLSSIYSEKQFGRSIVSHKNIVKSTFGVTPSTFYNFENIFFTRMGSILSENEFTSTFSGAIDWYLGSDLYQRVFHQVEDDQFKILLVDGDQTKSLFQVPDIKQHFLHFNSAQIVHLEGVNSIISKTSSIGKIVSIKKQLGSKNTIRPYNIKNPAMGSTQNLRLDSFNGNTLQNQVLKRYYQLEEPIEAANDKEALALWDKLGNAEYLYLMNVSELNSTEPYTAYNQLTNILTDLKLKLED